MQTRGDAQVTGAMITGALVGASVPPAGSWVTITRLTPFRLPGTPTLAEPSAHY